MKASTIGDIVEKAKQGDPQAFDMLYREYSEQIYKYAIKLGADEFLAEDVVSETFLDAIRNIDKLRVNAFFGTWLHSIAKNHVYKTMGRENRGKRIEFSYDGDDERERNSAEDILSADDPEFADQAIMMPDDLTENEETKQLIANIIESLNQEQKESIYLFYYRDKSIKDIAELMGVSTNTVKSRLRLAKNYIGEKIRELEKNGIVLSVVPMSMRDVLKGCGDRIKVRGFAAPAAVSGVSARVLAAAAGAVLIGTGIALRYATDSDNDIDKDILDSRIMISESRADDTSSDINLVLPNVPEDSDGESNSESRTAVVIYEDSEEDNANGDGSRVAVLPVVQQNGFVNRPNDGRTENNTTEPTTPGGGDNSRPSVGPSTPNNNGGNQPSTGPNRPNEPDQGEQSNIPDFSPEEWTSFEVGYTEYNFGQLRIPKYYRVNSYYNDDGLGIDDTFEILSIHQNFESYKTYVEFVAPNGLNINDIDIHLLFYFNHIGQRDSDCSAVEIIENGNSYMAVFDMEYYMENRPYNSISKLVFEFYKKSNGHYLQFTDYDHVDNNGTYLNNYRTFFPYFNNRTIFVREEVRYIEGMFSEDAHNLLLERDPNEIYLLTDPAYYIDSVYGEEVDEFIVDPNNETYITKDGVLYRALDLTYNDEEAENDLSRTGYALIWAPARDYSNFTFLDNIIAYDPNQIRRFGADSYDFGNNDWMATDEDFLALLN